MKTQSELTVHLQVLLSELMDQHLLVLPLMWNVEIERCEVAGKYGIVVTGVFEGEDTCLKTVFSRYEISFYDWLEFKSTKSFPRMRSVLRDLVYELAKVSGTGLIDRFTEEMTIAELLDNRESDVLSLLASEFVDVDTPIRRIRKLRYNRYAPFSQHVKVGGLRECATLEQAFATAAYMLLPMDRDTIGIMVWDALPSFFQGDRSGPRRHGCSGCKYFTPGNSFLNCAVNPELPENCSDYEAKE